MSITLGFDFKTGEVFSSSEFDKREHEAELTEYEEKAILIIKSAFKEEKLPLDKVYIKRYSDSYISLISSDGNDFCRIKAGPKSTWVSLDMWIAPKELQEDYRFLKVKNRNQRHWKINLNSVNDFENVTDLIIYVYKIL